MKLFWRFLFTGGHPYKLSKRRNDYERIAMEYGVTPDYVYYLAHGETSGHRGYDELILTELKQYGIIE